MYNYIKALENDKKGFIKEAVEFYQKSIANKETVNSFVNLSVIYWNISTDYGMETWAITNHSFSEKEIARFNQEYMNLIEQGLEEYPENSQLLFWKTLIVERDKSLPHTSTELMYSLINKDKKNLDPYFYLYVFAEVNGIEDKIGELFILLKNELTFKNKYILSFLEGFGNIYTQRQRN